MPWPDCASCHSLPDGCGGNRPPSGQPNVPANSRQSGLQVPLAASSPRYLALTNIRRRSQSLPAATEDRHRPPSTPNRARTIALPCPYRPFRCCIVIPSVDLGLHCICHSAGLGKPSSIVPWPDCAPCHSLPDGCGGNRPPSGQPNVPANSRQSGLQVPLAASSPRYLALTNIRRRSQSLPAATEDRHRPPSTPNRARTIALPCPYRPFRCCIVIPSVDLG